MINGLRGRIAVYHSRCPLIALVKSRSLIAFLLVRKNAAYKLIEDDRSSGCTRHSPACCDTRNSDDTLVVQEGAHVLRRLSECLLIERYLAHPVAF
jgi:hypothetical protein